MKQTIIDALPDSFRRLQETRQQAQAKIVTLTEKLEEHRLKVTEATGEIKRLEAEIAEIVSSGGDPAGLLRKLRSQREGIGDLQNVVTLAENAVEAAQAEEIRITKEMERSLQAVILGVRNFVAEGLQAEITSIESRVNQWRETVFAVAEELNLAAPSSGDEIVLKGLK